MTVYYKQSEPTEGFNATYVVFNCPDFCPPNRVCHNSRCVCREGSTGVYCQDLICPNDCNHDKGHGKCDNVRIYLYTIIYCLCVIKFSLKFIRNTDVVFVIVFMKEKTVPYWFLYLVIYDNL